MKSSKAECLPPAMLIFLVSCSVPQRTDTAQASPVGDAERLQMHQSLVGMDAIKDAVIEGDLELATSHAQPIIDNAFEDAPEAWRPHLDQFRAAGAEIADATSLNDAAYHLARMGMACGGCHRAVGVTISLPQGKPALEPNPMRRHQWAVDKMWDGLVVPSDDAWVGGATAVASSPLLPEQFSEGAVARWEDTVHRLGREAASQSGEARASSFGELLTTCSECHRAVRPF
ncbi:MAG: hypothetical protein AAF219_02770 [Myxococcota bacterium]